MQRLDFVVLGFPKCGTTALMRAVENNLNQVRVERMDGVLEAPFFFTESNRNLFLTMPPPPRGCVTGHKFTAYIYSAAAIKQLKETSPSVLFVVCVRDPIRSLFSWWNMHKNMAEKGINTTHFVNRDDQTRRFYIECSLDEYYQHFAKRRLRYSYYIEEFFKIVKDSNIMIISQEHFAKNPHDVLSVFANELGVQSPSQQIGKYKHIGYADRVDITNVSQAVQDELCEERKRMQMVFDRLHSFSQVKLLVGDAFSSARIHGATAIP